jgi:hypothetical protein
MTGSRFEPTADDLAFLDVYGEWDPLTPGELRDLMDGFPDPWWVAGGYAIEAFTGVARHHEDIDLVVFSTPEVTLLFKAKQHRRKDEIDLENAWPLMTAAQRRWLHDAVVRLHPGHPWSDRLRPTE